MKMSPCHVVLDLRARARRCADFCVRTGDGHACDNEYIRYLVAMAECSESTNGVESRETQPSLQDSSTAPSSVAFSQAASQASGDTFYTCKLHVSYYWCLYVNVKKRLYSKALSRSIHLKS
jgi:hypothetical protein